MHRCDVKPTDELKVLEAKSALITPGTPVVGNWRGIELAVGKVHLGEEVKILKDQIIEMQNTIVELRSAVADLQESEG